MGFIEVVGVNFFRASLRSLAVGCISSQNTGPFVPLDPNLSPILEHHVKSEKAVVLSLLQNSKEDALAILEALVATDDHNTVVILDQSAFYDHRFEVALNNAYLPLFTVSEDPAMRYRMPGTPSLERHDYYFAYHIVACPEISSAEKE